MCAATNLSEAKKRGQYINHRAIPSAEEKRPAELESCVSVDADIFFINKILHLFRQKRRVLQNIVLFVCIVTRNDR